LEGDAPLEDAGWGENKSHDENTESLYQARISALAKEFAAVVPHGEFSPLRFKAIC